MAQSKKKPGQDLRGKIRGRKWDACGTEVLFGCLAPITDFGRYKQMCVSLCEAMDRIPGQWQDRERPSYAMVLAGRRGQHTADRPVS